MTAAWNTTILKGRMPVEVAPTGGVFADDIPANVASVGGIAAAKTGAAKPAGEPGLNEAYAVYLAAPGERSMERMVQAAGRLIGHFTSMFGAAFTPDDLYQTAVIGLLKAARSYSAQRGAVFSTWASACILGELRHYARAEYRQSAAIPMEDAAQRQAAATQADAVETHADLMHAVEHLSTLEQQVLRALYTHGMTQEETARVLGLHQRKVSRVKQRALSALRELLSQPNFKLAGHAPSFHLMKEPPPR